MDILGCTQSNVFKKPTKVEESLGKDVNGNKARSDWNISYDTVIGIVLCLESNTRPGMYFTVHKCERFTYNT